MTQISWEYVKSLKFWNLEIIIISVHGDRVLLSSIEV